MLLSRLLDEYLRAHDLRPASAAHLRYTLGRFHRWLRRPPTTSDFTHDTLNQWIDTLLADTLARSTVRGYRGGLLTLWKFAFDVGATQTQPTRVRRVRFARQIPIAWTVSDVNRLVRACDRVEGRFRFHAVQYRDYLRALVLLAWDTGLRLGDLLAIQQHDINAVGLLAVVQQKTGTPILCRLRPETLAAVRRLPSQTFGIIGRGRILELFGELKRHAGLGGRDKTKGLRKAGATAIERLFPGQAGIFLGHLTPGLALRHYVDPRQLQQHRPRTPRLPCGAPREIAK